MTEKQYKADIIKSMKSLNIYKKEFSHAIEAFANILNEYEKTQALFEASGGQIMIKHTNKIGAVNAVKNPFYIALEGLRKDVLAYASALGLTPQGLKKINDEAFAAQKKASGLALVLKELKDTG